MRYAPASRLAYSDDVAVPELVADFGAKLALISAHASADRAAALKVLEGGVVGGTCQEPASLHNDSQSLPHTHTYDGRSRRRPRARGSRTSTSARSASAS